MCERKQKKEKEPQLWHWAPQHEPLDLKQARSCPHEAQPEEALPVPADLEVILGQQSLANRSCLLCLCHRLHRKLQLLIRVNELSIVCSTGNRRF